MNTCKAHNCPCMEYQNRLCRFHYDAEPKDWPSITDKINKNQRVLKAIGWAMTEGRYQDNETARKTLARLSEEYPSLEPLETETAMTWAYRALAWMSKTVSPLKYGNIARKIHFPRVRI